MVASNRQEVYMAGVPLTRSSDDSYTSSKRVISGPQAGTATMFSSFDLPIPTCSPMKHATTFLSFSLLFTLPSLGQDAEQFKLDLFSDVNPVSTASAMADGGLVMTLETDGEKLIWRGTPDGAPQWSKAIPPASIDHAIFPKADGGLYVADITASEYIDLPGEVDSMYAMLNVRNMMSDGTEQWSRALRFGFITTWGFESFVLSFKLSGAVRVGDELLIAMLSPDAGVLFLTLMDAGGDVSWSMRVMDTVFDGSEYMPTMPTEARAYEIDWISSADGSFIAILNDYSKTGLRVLKINADGSSAWTKRVIYADDQTGLVSRGVLLAGGDVLISSPFTYWVTGQQGTTAQLLAFRLNADGELVSKDLYNDISGGHPLVALPDGGWASCSPASLIQVDAAGEVVSRWKVESVIYAGDYMYSPRSHSFGLDADGFRVGLSIERHHTVLTTTDYAIGGTKVAASDPGCVYHPYAYDHWTIPDSLITEEPLANVHTIPVFPISSVTDPLGNATPLGTSPLCEMFLAVPQAGTDDLWSMPSLVGPNEVLIVSSKEPIGLTLFDAKGRVVRRIAQPAQRTDIPASELVPGLYLAQASDLSGKSIGTKKVMIGR